MSHTPGNCAVPGCGRRIPVAYLMCSTHWYRVSPSIRSRVYRTLDAYRMDNATLDELRAVQAEAVKSATTPASKGGAS